MPFRMATLASRYAVINDPAGIRNRKIPERREQDRTAQELEVRERFIREQSERVIEAWKKATPLDAVMSRLKTTPAKK
jgi:hypothetical protein